MDNKQEIENLLTSIVSNAEQIHGFAGKFNELAVKDLAENICECVIKIRAIDTAVEIHTGVGIFYHDGNKSHNI